MDWTDLIAFYRQAPTARYALVTLVEKEGASFRLPGARMLVRQDGVFAGCISAGCLEDSIAQQARSALQGGAAKLVTIDTRPHYGCYGNITLLLEPLAATAGEALLRPVQTALETRRPIRVLTDYRLDLDILPRTRVLESQDSASPDDGRFVETINPVPRMVIVGDWPDARMLSALARQLRWNLVTIDPGASGASADKLADLAPPDPWTSVVVMSHHLGRDVAYLAEALRRAFPYVGVIGSRRRRDELVKGLEQLEDPEIISNLHLMYCPAGLDLGSDDLGGMALSILSEIQTVFSGRDARPLRDRKCPIHDAS